MNKDVVLLTAYVDGQRSAEQELEVDAELANSP
jgi:anti-sigma factor RsiW